MEIIFSEFNSSSSLFLNYYFFANLNILFFLLNDNYDDYDDHDGLVAF